MKKGKKSVNTFRTQSTLYTFVVHNKFSHIQINLHRNHSHTHSSLMCTHTLHKLPRLLLRVVHLYRVQISQSVISSDCVKFAISGHQGYPAAPHPHWSDVSPTILDRVITLHCIEENRAIVASSCIQLPIQRDHT